MFEFFRQEPLYHYPLDRFAIKSPLIYRPEHRIVHIGGGPNRNHPSEINLNILPVENVDVVANAERLPFDDASIDVVISCAVLEHIRDAEAAIREMDRVLKPGGLVYIEIPFMQRYHIEDSHGVSFQDYRRFTRPGLVDAFAFCTPLDVGVCVGPTSAAMQVVFSLLQDFSAGQAWRRTVDGLYYLVGNLAVGIDARLSDATIRRSTIPSGIYFFGRKRDQLSQWLERLPQPNSICPSRPSAQIEVLNQDSRHVELRVTNTSQVIWLHASQLAWGAVHLGLQRRSGGTLDRDFRRFDLPGNITPGESFELTVDLVGLEDADAALVDLVIEDVCWFADQGNRPLRIDLRRHRMAA